MRKIFAVFTVVLLVALMAVPAFAIGASSTASQRYSALPFQYMYFNGVGGPFEYPLAQTRSTSIVQYVYDVQYGSKDYDISCSVSSYANYVDGNFRFPIDITRIAFDMRDAVACFDSADVQLHVFDLDVIWKIHIYGAYLVPGYDSNGRPKFTEVSFDTEFIENTQGLNLKDYLKATFIGSTSFNTSAQLFKYLCVDITIDIASNPGTDTHLEIYSPSSVFSYTAPNVAKWTSDAYAKLAPPVPPVIQQPPDVSFEIGSFLQKSVDAIVNFEIMPGFGINKLFTIALTISLALWALKVFS